MKPHSKVQSGPRQKLSSYFNEQIADQQLFGEESVVMQNDLEDQNEEYELSTNNYQQSHLNHQHPQQQKSKSSNNNSLRNHPNLQQEKILQHFYNPDSDGEEEVVTRPNNKPLYYPSQITPPFIPNKHQNSVTNKPAKTKKPSRQQPPIEPQPFPMYANPYQFFPFYPPFFSNYHSMNEEEHVKNNSNDTFMTDKSVEGSIFFEKDKNIELLLSESREMKQIIQSQSETISLILKQLENVNKNLENMKKEVATSQNFSKTNPQQEIDESQPQQPLSVSNQFSQNPLDRNSIISSASSIPNMSASYKSLASSMQSPSKFSKGHVNESMTNNTSNLHHNLNIGKNTSHVVSLDKSNNTSSSSNSMRSELHSTRYSVVSPSISNSPARSTSSKTHSVNTSKNSSNSS